MILPLLITVSSSIANLFLGLLVFIRTPKAARSRIFLLLTINMALWIVSNFFTDYAPGYQIRLISAHVNYLSPFLLLVFFYLFCSNFFNLGKLRRKEFWPFVVIIAIGSLLSISNLVVAGIDLGVDGTNIVQGPLYTSFLLSLPIFFIGGYTQLVRLKSRHKSRPVDRKQINFVLFGVSLSFILAFIFNAVLPSVLNDYASAKYGPSATLIIAGSMAYAIVRHRLFDIRAVVARSVTYVLSIAFIGLIYGFTAFQIITPFIRNTSVLTQQIGYTVLAIVLAFTFQPIRRFFERVSNKLFYKDRYDSQVLITEIGQIVASEIDLDIMTKKVLKELSEKIKISRAEIVIFGENQLFYENDVFKKDGQTISESDLLKLGRVMKVADELSSGEKKELMQSYGITVSLALRTTEKFLGYLLLAEKKSGDIYNTEDLNTLKTIANELSVAVQNSLSYKEIQQFSETLAGRVRQRTAQLRHANDQLKELDKAKDEFISMASHQLRTPLTTIKGYVSMLDEGDFGKLTHEQKKYIKQALDASNRMARLIDDLLNISRMEAGKFYIDAEKIDLNIVVPQELEQVKVLAESKNVDLHYVAPKKPIPKMNLDDNKTRQVIMNLADNAVHYSAPPKGGGKVEVRLEHDGDDMVYVVRDNGIGVPKDQQGKLFTKMFRARNAQEVRPDGTGLGLYMVKRVVEDQGGRIIFESTPGKGSVFGFRIPIHNKIVVDKKAQKALAQAHKSD